MGNGYRITPVPARVNKCVNQNFVVISRQARQVFRKTKGISQSLPLPCLRWRGFNLAVTLTASLTTNLGQHVLPNMARQNPSPHARFIARSVCEPGQVAGEERGLHQVSGGGAPSSPRWGFSQGTDLPTVGEPGRGNILFRPTVQLKLHIMGGGKCPI